MNSAARDFYAMSEGFTYCVPTWEGWEKGGVRVENASVVRVEERFPQNGSEARHSNYIDFLALELSDDFSRVRVAVKIFAKFSAHNGGYWNVV